MLGLGVAIVTVTMHLSTPAPAQSQPAPFQVPNSNHSADSLLSSLEPLPVCGQQSESRGAELATILDSHFSIPDALASFGGEPRLSSPVRLSVFGTLQPGRASPAASRRPQAALDSLAAGWMPSIVLLRAGAGLLARGRATARTTARYSSHVLASIHHRAVRPAVAAPATPEQVSTSTAADSRPTRIPLSQESIALPASLKNLAHGPRQTRNRQASISDAQNVARGERQRSLPQA
jgi:hypothetical protein